MNKCTSENGGGHHLVVLHVRDLTICSDFFFLFLFFKLHKSVFPSHRNQDTGKDEEN